MKTLVNPFGKQTGSEDDVFVLIEASKLSLDDAFLQYEPKTFIARRLKRFIRELIEHGDVEDFVRPKYDPSFTEDGTGICFVPGAIPATGKDCIWWKEAAANFMPKHNSRLGTKYEYIAFYGVLIKEMVAAGWDVEKAWHAVCNAGSTIARFYDPDCKQLDTTGSRELLGIFDLGNVRKIIANEKDDKRFLLSGGGYMYSDLAKPLVSLYIVDHPAYEGHEDTGWIVMSTSNFNHKAG